MKKLFVIVLGFLAQPALASSVSSVVSSVEYTYDVQCAYTRASKMEFCFGYICKYKKYYSCEGQQNALDLVLNIKTIRYPGEVAEEQVTNYSVDFK
ncbi:hypothetical protein EZJ49_03105 [Bdellovibrio bacteriovorus]|uniref:hypothetical protein n=1 Tax=Bdellovibrio bacteriovorus TaxID=959 RepID=UPI0021D1CF89|nr:hypothetical protein [Bdellovibrio bacteriovorus]UXR65237.1 hypothetical protein EZJ49_03105 [Bdellovibrio bacteriovorus]